MISNGPGVLHDHRHGRTSVRSTGRRHDEVVLETTAIDDPRVKTQSRDHAPIDIGGFSDLAVPL
jgi:hypothetical protein